MTLMIDQAVSTTGYVVVSLRDETKRYTAELGPFGPPLPALTDKAYVHGALREASSITDIAAATGYSEGEVRTAIEIYINGPTS